MENNNMKFEDALARLEEIVGSLEGGGAPLDRSLELFEEGVSLVKLCNSMLEGARQRVTLLTENGETEMPSAGQ